MTKEQKIEAYYHSLVYQKKVVDETKGILIDSSTFRMIADEIHRIEADFPGFLPPFKEGELLDHEGWYKVSALRTYLAAALGRLTVAVQTSKSTPVTETREFSFIKNIDLRKILERDYIEIQRAYIAQCWKSVIILSGSAIEAILLDLLKQNQGAAQGASTAPNESDITKWRLMDLIKVSVELGLVGASVEKLSHSVREYRNLIHPGNEIRNKLSFGVEEARIALEVLHIVHRDLSSHP